MAKSCCEKAITVDMDNYDLFLESDEKYLTLMCDRREDHKGRHKDKTYGISWKRGKYGSPELKMGSYLG